MTSDVMPLPLRGRGRGELIGLLYIPRHLCKDAPGNIDLTALALRLRKLFIKDLLKAEKAVHDADAYRRCDDLVANYNVKDRLAKYERLCRALLT